ncbi:hypothetical protein [Marinicauda sp. Alg238-R41]|uniref:hypothetical protein n=1 Tax=Marinicauda sp. Alg238-R41 TaxID=2993447 RepID=UPI0022DFC748|nr:hypothetical protein [Marinicauda sp. Alg238-R41]
MEFVDQIWVYIEPVWNWLYTGLEMYGPLAADGSVNWVHFGIQAGVIALVMALVMQAYGAILIFTIVGTVVHVVVDRVLPMVREGESFVMPEVTNTGFWQYVAFLAIFYLVAITILSMIKALIFRGD